MTSDLIQEIPTNSTPTDIESRPLVSLEEMEAHSANQSAETISADNANEELDFNPQALSELYGGTAVSRASQSDSRHSSNDTGERIKEKIRAIHKRERTFDSSYSGDQSLEIVIEPAVVQAEAGESIEEIARGHLGEDVDDETVVKYAEEIARLNLLEESGGALAEDRQLLLPGHGEDGGFTVRFAHGGERTTWSDGTYVHDYGNGNGMLVLPDGTRERLNANELESVEHRHEGHISVENSMEKRVWQFRGDQLRYQSVERADGSSTVVLHGSDSSTVEVNRSSENDVHVIGRDSDGNVTSIAYPDGSSVKIGYDDQGNINEFTDPDGDTWRRMGDSNIYVAVGGWLPKVRQMDIQVNQENAALTIVDHRTGITTETTPQGEVAETYPELDAQHFHSLLEENWNAIDTDGNNRISADEVDAAVVNSAFRGEDAMLVAALKQSFDALKELDRGHFFQDRNRELTREDLEMIPEVYSQLMREVRYARKVHAFAEEEFEQIDTNNDNLIDRDEIDDAAGEDRYSEEEKGYLEHLEDNYEDFVGDGDGITIEQLDGYHNVAYDSDSGELFNNIDRWMDHVATDVENLDRRLYTSDDPIDSIVPEAVRQTIIGDCYFMSAVASVAGSDPEQIRDMIEDNGDGTYTVTFPGDPDNPVTVTEPTDTELALYANITDTGIWPAILEKAYGEWKGDEVIPQEGADGGGWFDDTIETLTGEETGRSEIKDHSVEEIQNMLQAAIENGDAICVSVFENNPDLFPDLAKKHAYSVLDYDPETNQVTIRNPWGSGEPEDENGNVLDGENDGIFVVSMDEFYEHFKHISIQGVA